MCLQYEEPTTNSPKVSVSYILCVYKFNGFKKKFNFQMYMLKKS